MIWNIRAFIWRRRAEKAEAKLKRYEELFRWQNEKCRDCADAHRSVCQHDKFKPNPTLTWLGSSMDINANTHLWRCTVCDHRFDLPIAFAADGAAKP